MQPKIIKMINRTKKILNGDDAFYIKVHTRDNFFPKGYFKRDDLIPKISKYQDLIYKTKWYSFMDFISVRKSRKTSSATLRHHCVL